MPKEALAKIPLFSGLGEGELESLARGAVVRSFPRQSVLINEGDDSDALYVIFSGQLKVFLSDEQGREIVLNQMGEGEYFGELALLDDTPRSASVMVVEACKVAIISRAVFDKVLDEHVGMARKLLAGLSKRLRMATDNIRSLALLDVYGRVARLLIDAAAEEEGRFITPKMTQQDMADRVGSSREMVSRILKDLRAGDYITMEGKRIIIERALPERW
ncbi:MAG TPA: Crp/Fnr family transcriptional regulator [Chromatiaceae bacterium]|jgi:CRP/FNR family cyclic AMP-dependent transcriptional regulator|nr:Crp/Fnr family transcriptional regulator [Chromatiaceae bacterium]HIA08499.1 Crp/Fnr family transcriptional regulator [Chromatiaceae bacterium]HIN83262.1 Crp/Fnr family transcriptional regulator [Chromatiales bacterium]HIO14589.1 Crp/Fnr family transcriptional regulator [Chromatiales bacterium]HIO55379.1 Crp/Fnr family transcriptional regulator [Chromatiales bacterium]